MDAHNLAVWRVDTAARRRAHRALQHDVVTLLLQDSSLAMMVTPTLETDAGIAP